MALPAAPLGTDPVVSAGLDTGDVGLERSPSRVWSQLRTGGAFWMGTIIVTAMVALAIGADWLAPYDPNFAIRSGGLTEDGRPVGFGSEFALGTDRLGRDYLSRLLHGARTSLIVAIGANVVAAIVGSVVGAVAAFAGSPRVSVRFAGRKGSVTLPIESLLMRLTDAFLSLPILLLAIALATLLGPSLLLLTVVIAALWWTTTARMAYTQVRVVLGREFIEAARSVGVPPTAVLVRHVLPHVAPVVVVYATIGVAAVVLFESALSFIGAGVPPPAASWGTMISEHASYYRSDPRLLLLPGGAIALTVLGFTLLGDALRDALDPRTESTI